MKKVVFLFVFAFLYSTLMNAQAFDTKKIDATLDVSQQESLLTVKGIVANSNSGSVPVTYRLKVLKLSNGNKSNSVQANIQEIEANKTVELSSTSINYSANDEIYISFLVKVNDVIIEEIEKTIPEGIDKEKFKTNQNTTRRQPKQTSDAQSQMDLFRKHLEDFQGRHTRKRDSLKKYAKKSYYGEMLNGIVIDETITRMGKEFYDYFYSSYQIKNRETPVLLTMKEVFLQNRTIHRSKVIIKNDDIIIFQAILQPRADYLEAVSQQANYIVNQYLSMAKKSSNK